MKVMAGLETEFNGEAWAADGVKIGYLPQEPELDDTKDVMGNVMEAMSETKGLLDRFNEVSGKFAEPMEDDEMNALIEEQGELQEKIDAVERLVDLERTVEIAMDALRCPPGVPQVASLSRAVRRRRVALCRLLLSEARHAAAR